MIHEDTALPAGAANDVRVALCAPGEVWGGVEQFIDSLARHFAATGVPVVVIVLFDGPLRSRLERAGIPVYVPKAGRYSPQSIMQIAGVLRQHRITVVHTHGYKATIVGAIAARLANARLVRTEHGRLEPGRGLGQLKMRFNTGMEALVSRYAADAVVFVSHDVKSHSRSVGAKALQRVVYNGLEPLKVSAPAHALDGFDAGPGRFNIGIIGRLVEVKGHAFLLRALKQLRHLPDLRLYVFGEGPLENECRALCAAASLESTVRFMGFKDNVTDYLKHLDLLVMPSLHEGLPFTLLEAMYQRVPVLASRVGGLAEVIRHDISGILVAPGDERSLATAIERLHDDAALRHRLAENAHRIVCKTFLVDAMAEQYLDVYSRVAAVRR